MRKRGGQDIRSQKAEPKFEKINNAWYEFFLIPEP
jgi:hypothetical protein